MDAAPTLSIISGTRDRKEELARLIKSVVEHTCDVDWELVIADAGERYHPWHPHPRVKIVPERPRLWPAAGYNRLVREHARGEWVAWLNDDAEVTPRWALAMLSALSNRKDVGLGCFYFEDEGTYGPGFRVNDWLGLVYANFGCIRRELFLEVGGFDERCKFYAMDNSLTFRVMDRGLGVLAVPGARVVHHRHWSERRSADQDEAESFRAAGVNALMADYEAKIGRFKSEQARFRPAAMVLPDSVCAQAAGAARGVAGGSEIVSGVA